ncbi:hypothetical protein D3C81_1345780 [compost metagenome]
MPRPEATQVQAAEIGYDTRQDQRPETREALEHAALLPGRHIVHARQQNRRHQCHRQHQFKQEAGPPRLRFEQPLAAQFPEQQAGIEAGTEADRQGQPGMRKRANQGQVQQLGAHQREHRDLHWGTDILLRIEAWCQHLDQNDRQQAHRIGHQRALGHRRIERAELAVLEQRHGHRLGQNGHGQGAGQHQQEAQAQAPVEDA